MYSGCVDISGSPAAEPMNLGSPVGSPNNASGYAGPQFLPSFLIGDPSGSPNNSRLWSTPSSTISPPKNRPVSQYAPGLSSSPSKALFSPIAANTSLSRTFGRPTTTDKHGGPPIQGLFDHMSTPPTSRVPLVGGSITPPSGKTSHSFFASTNTSPVRMSNVLMHDTTGKSMLLEQSPAQIDPFYTQGQSLSSQDQLDETWITIFGFPPAAASYILQQFYHYGTIIEHKLPPSGNWMHIRYQSKLQAKIALSKNGKIFGNYMVGVTPCIDKSIIYANLPKCAKQVTSPNVSGVLHTDSQSPFTAADFSVINSGQIPHRKTGILTKAKELLFNW